MKLIPLSKNSKNPLIKDKYFAMVDDEDYDWLIKLTWSVNKDGRTYYARHSKKISANKNKCIPMHRMILGITDPSMLVDHIDHDGLNNQRSNLRTCNYAENARNAVSFGATSKYRGVAWSKYNRKWKVTINFNRIAHYLGYYDSEEEAARVYDTKAMEFHGEFANLNFKEQ